MSSLEYQPTVVDTIVIGGGAAGLTAATVIGRARRDVVVVDSGRPRNAPAAHMHGFLSRDGMAPAELLATGRAEAAHYGVQFVDSVVNSVRWRGAEAGFTVELDGGTALLADTILVSTGLHDELPELPGIRERWGADIFHCPYCHAYEVRDQPLGVLVSGNPAMSVHQALLLRQWTGDVVLFANGNELTDRQRRELAAREVVIDDGTVTSLAIAGDRLAGVELADGRSVPRAALVVAPRFVPHDALLTQLGCDVAPGGLVAVDAAGRTSVPGVWAAGNVVDPRAQVITAAGAGSAAAIAINGYLLDRDVERALSTAARHHDTHPPFDAATERRVHDAVGAESRHGL
ncbi:NAD(P)/FAD-dependent oxidoreductase [Nocardia rhizosphaerae]|uniref:NAD(P)/FAD-dependent oxidoreductase n=1 Tax=Nocardia rhizosphaerae TaxID=1691571 RepID=A0ABV8L676_9NOCA